MEWTRDIQKIIEYIELNLLDLDLDCEKVAKEFYLSSSQIQVLFSTMCEYSISEYIRNRRLYLAALELVNTKDRIIDIAAKYGYETPDGFARAFQKYHKASPSQIRKKMSGIVEFLPISVRIIREGGRDIYGETCEVRYVDEFTLIGFKAKFTGSVEDRIEQEEELYLKSRIKQFVLQGLAFECKSTKEISDTYNVMTDYSSEGYSFFISKKLDDDIVNNLADYLGEEIHQFETIIIPRGKYMICRSKKTKYPVIEISQFRRLITEVHLKELGLEIDNNRPEICKYHWPYNPEYDVSNNGRYAEMWIPIR